MRRGGYHSVKRITIEETSLAFAGNQELYITISTGIATWDGQEQIDIPTLLDRADQALYISKQTGRNKVTTWKES